MKELLSKEFNGKRKNNCLCRENYQILMSNHREKDKEGNDFMYSLERENKTFWLLQKQKKKNNPTEDCLPHIISVTDEKREIKSIV